MQNFKLPLDPVFLSVSIENERGPVPDVAHALVEMPFESLSGGVVRRMVPDGVICWLFCARYDVFDIAALLADTRFEGELIAVANSLPRRGMVEREVRARFPALRFRVLSPAPMSGGAARYFNWVSAPATVLPETDPVQA